MLQQNEIINYLKTNKLRFAVQFNILKIGIFGSYARNEQTENSDIDILIEMQPETEDIFEKRLMLKELLSKHFSKPVDVCHLRAIKPLFRELILKDVIYV
jgi:predicted nucleotidyltransferase